MADSFFGGLMDEEERRVKGVAAPTSSIGSLMDAEHEARRQRLAGSIHQSFKTNPDEYAKALARSRTLNVPVAATEADPDEAQRRVALLQADELLKTNPALGERLASPGFAKLASDDIATLSEAERQFGVWRQIKQPEASFGSIAKGLMRNLPDTLAVMRESARMQFADAFGLTGMSKDAQKKYSALQTSIQLDTPKFDSWTADAIYGGYISLGRQIPGIAASVLTRSPAPSLALAGLSTEADAYGKYRTRGASGGEAAAGALGEGAVEVLTELLPMRFLTQAFGKMGAGDFVKGLFGREVGTEQAATLLQDALDTAIANPDKTWGDYLRERPEAQYKTLIATIVQSGTLGAANKVAITFAQHAQRADAAARDAEVIGQLGQLAAASKLRERDPATFQEFIDTAAKDGPVQDLFIDGRLLVQTLQQAGIDPATLPTVAAQIGEAVATGGDVRLPIGEFTANVAATDIGKALLPHLKTSPEAMSQAEAQTFYQEQAEVFKQEAARILESEKQDTAVQEGAEAVRQHFMQQLKGANRFTTQVNDAYSTLLRDFYVTTAKRLGITPQEMLARYPLRVAAENVAAENTIDQPAFHGSPHKFDKFSLHAIGTGEGAQAYGWGLYFTTKKEIAEWYRDVITPMDQPKTGRVYQVEIPSDDTMLDWDAPLNQQPPAVKTALENNPLLASLFTLEPRNGGELYELLSQHQEQSTGVGPEGASRALASLGVKGIKFVGQTSGETNYVVFDDQVISITSYEQALSTRVPRGKKPAADPMTEELVIDVNAMRGNDKAFEKNVLAMTHAVSPTDKKPGRYVNYREAKSADTVEKKLNRIVKQMVDNLLWLHDQVPPEVRARSKMWYDGARKIVDQWAPHYGLSDMQIAGVLAALSPQTEWNTNVTDAQRVLDVYTTKQDFTWDDAMEKTASVILKKKKFTSARNAMRGKKLSELENNGLRAMWIRVYDEAHNDRSYRVVTPEGGFGDVVRNRGKGGGPGRPSKNAWFSFANIAKAVSVIRDGSVENVSKQLGTAHKVRNFYNNIFWPDNPAGHVTIDTHATAAANLRPLVGSSIEVKHNLGGGAGISNTLATGTEGTYGIIAEAYRIAAARRGLMPRQMQSITWEAVRGLYTADFKKNKSHLVEIDRIWDNFRKGKLSYEDTRQQLLERAGGINHPDWWRPDSGATAESRTASDAGQLAGTQLPGGGAGPTAGGSGSDDTAGGGRTAPAGQPGADRDGATAGEPTGDGRGDAGLAAAQEQARAAAGSEQSLVGLPASPMRVAGTMYVPGPVALAHEAARKYAASAGIEYKPLRTFRKVDRERAARIAGEYAAMEHAPDDPQVKAAYDAMISETLAQYRAILETGLTVEFISGADPYGSNPRAVMVDVIQNNHLWVFSTRDGFGSDATFDPSQNPLLAETEFEISGQRALANDIFRVVHDYFGHIKDGNGFRADGEENAWRSHSRMYSPLARRAMTSETRGQNSWVNFGPHGDKNRTASAADTVYADQKTGLMPEWVSEEGAEDLNSLRQDRNDEIDKLPDETKSDLAMVIAEGRAATGFVDAFEKQEGRKPDEDDVRANLFGMADPLSLVEVELNPADISIDEERGVSERAVTRFQEMLSSSSAPAILVARSGAGYRLIEGGHRLAAAKRAGVSTIRAVDVGALDNIDWGAYLDGAPTDTLQQQARGNIQFANDITATPTTITLLKDADLSTFLHETGHFFLEVMVSISKQPNAPVEITKDLGKLFTWFGVESADAWSKLTLEEKRPHHEKFARGFEAYLFEGTSPNVELQSLFERFRSWLVNVYKSIKSLNVTLTSEVRSVMDRMIASEEQIAISEQARNYQRLFANAEEAGMTPAEWDSYQGLATDATQDATKELERRSLANMKWLSNAKSKRISELQAEAADKRKVERAAVEAEVDQQPVYAAQKWLKTGVLPDGEKTVGAKLSTDALREMYGEGPAAPWRYIATNMVSADKEGSLHPDTVAEMFGFTSGDELVRKILSAENREEVVDAMTDQRMLERHGDLADEKQIERAAEAAIHNEARAKFIAAELRALDRQINVRAPTGKTDKKGRPLSFNVLQRAAKQFAERSIAEKVITQIKPARYEAAEARAAKAAQTALAAGKTQEAAVEKRNQLVNHYASRTAHEAVDEVERSLRYLRKFESEGTRKSLDPDYVEQIDQLMERFDLRRASTREVERRKSLADWIKAQQEAGFEPAISEELQAEALRQHYSTLRLDEFRGLVDAVRNIEHLGRLKKKLLTAKDEREFAERVAEAVASVEEHAKGLVPERRTSDRGILVDPAKLFRQFTAEHRKFSSLVREMDGFEDGGVLWELFSRTMNERGDKEAVEREKATIKLAALLKPILKGEKLGAKTWIGEVGKTFTREERLGVALNMGNEINRERVLTGEGWTPQQLATVLDTLSKEEWDFVQSVWDYFESFRPEMAEKQKRVTGIEPEWVEAQEIITKHGSYRGGYYPIKYDAMRSDRSKADDAASIQRQMERGHYVRAQTRRGHLQERAESTGRQIRFDLGVITQHVDQVIHDLAWHEWLIDMNRLLKPGGALNNAIFAHYGQEKLDQLKNAIRDITIGDIPATEGFEKTMNHLRHGATIVGLGWNVVTSLLQPFGLTQSMVRVGPKWIAKGLAKWVGDAARMEASTTAIYEKSSFMRLRGKTMQREINEIRNKVADRSSVLEASYFWMIQKMQMVADVPTWLGAYEKHMAEPDMTEDKAIALADQAVIDSQGSGQIKDLAAIQRGHPAKKLWTNFYSFFNTTYNLAVERTKGADSPLKVAGLAVDYLMLFVVPAVLGGALKAALNWDDDDDEEKLVEVLLREQINYLLGTMIGLRELGAAVQGFQGYSGPGGTRFFSEMGKLVKQASQGEVDEAAIKAFVNTLGVVFHLPTGQVTRMADGIHALTTGATENPGALLVGSRDN